MNMEYTPEQVIKWEIKELWNVFLQLLNQEDNKGRSLEHKYMAEKNMVKYGLYVKFPIHKVINEFIIEYPIYNKVSILGIGKYRDIDYYDEIDKRCSIMREILIENYDDDTITKPREK